MPVAKDRELPTWEELCEARCWLQAGAPAASRSHDAKKCVGILYALTEDLPAHLDRYCYGSEEWKADRAKVRAAEKGGA